MSFRRVRYGCTPGGFKAPPATEERAECQLWCSSLKPCASWRHSEILSAHEAIRCSDYTHLFSRCLKRQSLIIPVRSSHVAVPHAQEVSRVTHAKTVIIASIARSKVEPARLQTLSETLTTKLEILETIADKLSAQGWSWCYCHFTRRFQNEQALAALQAPYTE